MSVEIWKPVSWAKGYEVSSQGRVGSWLPVRNFAPLPTERRILKYQIDKDGYHRYVLRVSGSPKDVRGAVLVCEAWCGPRPSGMLVRHLDGSKDNDTPANLIWGTPLENSADSARHGTVRNGSKINTSKLSEGDALYVLKSAMGHSELARELNVTPGAIWHIRAGRTWKHLQEVRMLNDN